MSGEYTRGAVRAWEHSTPSFSGRTATVVMTIKGRLHADMFAVTVKNFVMHRRAGLRSLIQTPTSLDCINTATELSGVPSNF